MVQIYRLAPVLVAVERVALVATLLYLTEEEMADRQCPLAYLARQ